MLPRIGAYINEHASQMHIQNRLDHIADGIKKTILYSSPVVLVHLI